MLTDEVIDYEVKTMYCHTWEVGYQQFCNINHDGSAGKMVVNGAKERGCKLSDSKTVGGKQRLADVNVDQIQNFFWQAVRQNSKLQLMKDAIWAIYHHVIQDVPRVPAFGQNMLLHQRQKPRGANFGRIK